MNNTMNDVSSTELETIDGGLERGSACGLAVGAVIGVGFFFGPFVALALAPNAVVICAGDT